MSASGKTWTSVVSRSQVAAVLKVGEGHVIEKGLRLGCRVLLVDALRDDEAP